MATYQSTERQRHDLAEQVGNMATFLQTRIELGLQRQNAELLASLNRGTERQLRLQRTVEGVSTRPQPCAAGAIAARYRD